MAKVSLACIIIGCGGGVMGTGSLLTVMEGMCCRDVDRAMLVSLPPIFVLLLTMVIVAVAGIAATAAGSANDAVVVVVVVVARAAVALVAVDADKVVVGAAVAERTMWTPSCADRLRRIDVLANVTKVGTPLLLAPGLKKRLVDAPAGLLAAAAETDDGDGDANVITGDEAIDDASLSPPPMKNMSRCGGMFASVGFWWWGREEGRGQYRLAG